MAKIDWHLNDTNQFLIQLAAQLDGHCSGKCRWINWYHDPLMDQLVPKPKKNRQNMWVCNKCGNPWEPAKPQDVMYRFPYYKALDVRNEPTRWKLHDNGSRRLASLPEPQHELETGGLPPFLGVGLLSSALLAGGYLLFR